MPYAISDRIQSVS